MNGSLEKAYAKYYSKLDLVSLPLICWDLFASHDYDLQQYNLLQKDWKSKESFRNIVHQSNREIIITDPQQQIVFATQGIYQMNGYRPFEIIGKSPKIFQGELTSSETRIRIRQAIQNQLPFKELVFNYKKDGSTYLCEIEAYPKFNKEGKLLNYIALEKAV